MGVRLSGFKSRLRHHKRNGGLADSSVNPPFLSGKLVAGLIDGLPGIGHIKLYPIFPLKYDEGYADDNHKRRDAVVQIWCPCLRFFNKAGSSISAVTATPQERKFNDVIPVENRDGICSSSRLCL